LQTDTEVALYRVIQELMTNAIRHAKASEVVVQVVFAESSMSITVEDNGVGFEVTSAKGNGLSNIHSRIVKLAGKVDVKSSTGEGTSVHIELVV
jgi:two-component system NarL family sensor kinase